MITTPTTNDNNLKGAYIIINTDANINPYLITLSNATLLSLIPGVGGGGSKITIQNRADKDVYVKLLKLTN